MSGQLTDKEVFTQVLEQGMSPDQLDAWYRSITTEPSAYQKSLFADGRMWLLQREQPVARLLHLSGPPESMRKLTVHCDTEPACMQEFLRCKTNEAGALSWLVPSAEYQYLVKRLSKLGYVEVKA